MELTLKVYAKFGVEIYVAAKKGIQTQNQTSLLEIRYRPCETSPSAETRYR